MSKNKKTILVNGALGRMGQSIVSLCKEREDVVIKYAVEHPKHKLIGNSIYSDKEIKTFKLDDIKLSHLPSNINVDFIIDFSLPSSAIQLARKAGQLKIPFVTGTTGFNKRQISELKKISKKIPILQSYNMSIGINIIIKILKENIKYFGDTDLEITETHHKEKIDSPSGTALLLADSIVTFSGKNNPKKINYRGKSNSKKRKKEEIGISVLRGGNIVGEHKISSFGQKENIYLTHEALDREIFSRGSIDLGLKLLKKKKGFFSVEDLI